MNDGTSSADGVHAALNVGVVSLDDCQALGSFEIECHDSLGVTVWRERVDNLFTTVGKNLLLNEAYAGSSYTAAEYVGLISSVGYSALVAADTMASHAGWNEAQNTGTNTPAYGTARPAATYGAAAGGIIAMTAPASFVMTGAGTVQGAFVVGGSGASATVGSTTGVLMNEGLLGTPQPVIATNTLTISHSGTLT